MSSGLEFRIEQLIIGRKFKFPPIGGNKCECFDICFKLFQNVFRQTDGASGVVSSRAVNKFDLYHERISFFMFKCKQVGIMPKYNTGRTYAASARSII